MRRQDTGLSSMGGGQPSMLGEARRDQLGDNNVGGNFARHSVHRALDRKEPARRA